MRSIDSLEKTEFTEDDFFHLGLVRFLAQGSENIEKVVLGGMVGSSAGSYLSVDPEFFLEMAELGKEVWEEKVKNEKGG